jgi:hypothetical protein
LLNYTTRFAILNQGITTNQLLHPQLGRLGILQPRQSMSDAAIYHQLRQTFINPV